MAILPRAVLLMATLGAVVCLRADAGQIVIDDFASPDAWQFHADGGVRPEFTADREVYRSTPAALRVQYHDAPPHWGNLARDCKVPPNAVAVTFDLYVREAAQGSAMHVWLWEADNDAWSIQVRDGDDPVALMRPGWHRIRLPLGRFSFDPRGPGSRSMTSVVRMLLGFNFADMDVTVDDLAFETREGGGPPMGAPKTANLESRRGPRGSVAVLRDAFPAGEGCANPDRLGVLLEKAGYGVTFLTGGDLSEPGVLERLAPDVLILPYGPSYPAGAAGVIQEWLRRGRAILSIGGYAFDSPMEFSDGKWAPAGEERTAAELGGNGGGPPQLNTRRGNAGDALALAPEQIQVFDPAFLLRRATAIRTAPGQSLVREGLRADAPVAGYSAVSTLGSNSAVFPVIWGRRIPLVEAVDALGRPRGTVGALVHSFAGPYSGSSLGIFGVTNRDLFTAESAPLAESLPAIVDALARPRYISRLRTAQACYRQGETVTIEGEVRAKGVDAGALRVAVDVPELGIAGLPAGSLVMVGEGCYTFRVALPKSDFATDLCHVRATLSVGDAAADRNETAFVVWNEQTLARGPKLAIAGSYLTVNGRAKFLSGTNETGFVWFSEHEDPLVWDSDFRAMADRGVRIVRLLHFSPFAEGGYEGKVGNSPLTLSNRPERLLRQADAIVQLAQKHGIAIFLSLHDWMGIALTDEEYRAQREWDAFWASRYREVPGVLYDIQNEPDIGAPPDTPTTRRIWNGLLVARYGNVDALREAWGAADLGGAWGDIPVKPGGGDWSDVRSHDYARFRMEVYNHWVEENAAGVHEGSPAALATVGNLQMNSTADKQVGSHHVDFTNSHFYVSLPDFVRGLPFSDRRWEGKPLSVGEFGAMEAHDQRTAGEDGTRDAESIRRFLWFGHYAFGLGGSFLANWSWKDFEGCVFPWGLRYLEDDVDKDVLSAYRAQALLLERLRPVYDPPAVYVVLPDCHRFGPMYGEIETALGRVFSALIHTGRPFGVLGEWDLDRLPGSARALVWPVPYCTADATFDRIERFVRGGGSLYVSGDVAFDEFRRPTRAERVTRLGLPEISHVPPAAVPAEALARPVAISSVGSGRVFFVPYPLELRAPAQMVATYTRFLEFAGEKPVTDCEPPGQVLRVRTEGGGSVDVMGNVSPTGTAVDVHAPEYTIPLGPLECGLVAVDANGGVTAFHTPGKLRTRGGMPIVDGDVHILGFALSGTIAGAETVILAPLSQGQTVVDALAGADTARLEIGEIVDGKWVARASRSVTRGPGGYRLTIGEAECFSLVALTRATGPVKWEPLAE